MNKTIITFFILVFSIINITAVTQNELLQYRFEEGGGSVILDTSGNDNHGIVTGALWDLNNKFGTYALSFDGANDWAESITTDNIPDQITFSFWLNTDTNAKTTAWTIYDTTDLIEFSFDTNSQIDFSYKNLNGTIDTEVLSIGTYTTDAYYHIILSIDSDTNEYKFYINNAQISNGTLTNTMSRQSLDNVLRIGTDSIGSNDFSGLIDEFRIFDFIVSESQISELYTNNVITFVEDPINNNGTQPTSIINYATPDNETIYSNEVEFNLNLNVSSDCQFYINNVLTYEFNDIVAVSFVESLQEGDYKYFYHCSYLDESNILNYEISNIYTFDVVQPPTTITFNLVAEDFVANDEELYITTPCAVEGYSAIGVIEGYQAKYNPAGIQWTPFNNGVAVVNTTAGTHEFCLFNGRVIYNELNQTTDYTVLEKRGMLELGNINIPSQINNYLTIKTNTFEIFDKTTPEAYGKNWGGLITGLLLLFLGVIIIIFGAKSGNGGAVVVGGILSTLALGYEITGLIGILVGI